MLLSLHTLGRQCRVIYRLATACNEFRLTVSLKKTEFMLPDVNDAPNISIGEHTLNIVEKFTYLGSTITNNLSLESVLNTRLGKAAT